MCLSVCVFVWVCVCQRRLLCLRYNTPKRHIRQRRAFLCKLCRHIGTSFRSQTHRMCRRFAHNSMSIWQKCYTVTVNQWRTRKNRPFTATAMSSDLTVTWFSRIMSNKLHILRFIAARHNVRFIPQQEPEKVRTAKPRSYEIQNLKKIDSHLNCIWWLLFHRFAAASNVHSARAWNVPYVLSFWGSMVAYEYETFVPFSVSCWRFCCCCCCCSCSTQSHAQQLRLNEFRMRVACTMQIS